MYDSKKKYRDLRRRIYLDRKGELIDPLEVKRLNNTLVTQFTPEQIAEKIDEVRLHPSSYPTLFIDLLSTPKKISDKENKLQPEKESLDEESQTTVEKDPKVFHVVETFEDEDLNSCSKTRQGNALEAA